MAGTISIVPARLSVAPGASGTTSVKIRNTGVVVDQFSVSVLGAAAVWTTAVPAVLSLFPGAEGNIELHVAPPRTADLHAGSVPFAVRVDASQDPDGSVVEEGEIELLPFFDVQAKLTPRTSEAKRKARHEVMVDNRGNAPVEVAIRAGDPDELLAFDVASRTVDVPAGQSVHVGVKVAAKKGFLRGTDRHRPFQVGVDVGEGHPPITLDGTLVQQAGLPRFIVPLVGAAVVLALAALVLPGMLGKGGSGTLSLTSGQSATTTTAGAGAGEAAPDAGPDDPNAPASAEEQAAAAEAERLANGQDGSGEAPGGGSTTGAGATGSGGGATAGVGASSGGGTTSGGTTGGTSTGSGSTTGTPSGGTAEGEAGSAPAAPSEQPGGTSVSTAPASPATTTTTVAASRSTSKHFIGNWRTKDGGSMSIDTNPFQRSNLNVKVSASFGEFSCTGAIRDADDDGSFSCTSGVTYVFTHEPSTDQVRVTYPRGVSYCPRTGCTALFDRA